MPPPRAKKTADSIQERTLSRIASESDHDNNTSALLTQQFSAASLPDIDEHSEMARNSTNTLTLRQEQSGQMSPSRSPIGAINAPQQNERAAGPASPADREIDQIDHAVQQTSDRLLRVVQPACDSDYVAQHANEAGQIHANEAGQIHANEAGQTQANEAGQIFGNQSGTIGEGTFGGAASGQNSDSDDNVRIYEARPML